MQLWRKDIKGKVFQPAIFEVGYYLVGFFIVL